MSVRSQFIDGGSARVFRKSRGSRLARKRRDRIGWIQSGARRVPVVMVKGAWIDPVLAERFKTLVRRRVA